MPLDSFRPAKMNNLDESLFLFCLGQRVGPANIIDAIPIAVRNRDCSNKD